MTPALIDLSPLAWLLLAGTALAGAPLAWLLWRTRGASSVVRLRALTLLTLFLTFDLVLFGAYTRLSDSGLGCPDWPGCYGNATPLGAHAEISQAQAAMPSGPVTHGKAWVEMVHRYLASGVGLLLIVLAAWTWRVARRPLRPGITPIKPITPVTPGWALLSLVWVCAQGAFGALTVTMKLYPAIVTGHLLGGLGLLALLAVQAQRYAVHDPAAARAWLPAPVALSPTLRWAVIGVGLLTIAQVTLGGWVSTNYAVLACSDFPTCHGSWWPEADFAQGFTLLRPLGLNADGSYLSTRALTAIHLTHRLAAVGVLAALLALAWALRRSPSAAAAPYARALTALALWQLASGLSNVVLGWPLLAALAHTGGAAALVAVLAALLAATARPSHSAGTARAAGHPERPTPPSATLSSP